MYSVHKTVHQPTGIDDAVYCNFINDKDDNLITFSANRLQVYRICADKKNKSNKTKLEFIESFYLYGNIAAIKPCRYGVMKKDALILAFTDAKLSIVEYDSFSGDLTTLSIHYFEDELEIEGIHLNTFPPILKVDPNMRCAVMLIYGFKLVVIPFYEEYNANNNIKQESNKIIKSETNNNNDNNSYNNNSNIKLEPNTDNVENSNLKSEKNINQTNTNIHKSSSLSSYTIDLRILDNWLEMRIVDIEFLYGYYEPTLYILSESNMTWVGRYAVKKDTCNSVALSLNLNQRTHPIIWPVDKLPSDIIKCLAVPPPIGGVLLFGVNSLIYINQSVPSYGISLNSLTKIASNYPFKSMEHARITLDSSQAVFIASDRLILSLKGGEIYIITMLTDPESLRTVRNFHIEKGPGSVIASCLLKCNDNLLFVGSRLGNSVLLRYNVKLNTAVDNEIDEEIEQEKEQEAKNENLELEFDYENNNNKTIQIDSENDNKMDTKDQEIYINDFDELDQILDKNEEKSVKNNIVSHSFEICDILLNIAPCGHSIIGESLGDFSDFSESSSNLNHQIDLVTSSGYTKNGAISVLQRSIRPEIIATFQISDVIDMWSVFNSENVDSDNESSMPTTYLFLTKSDSTTILQMGNEITELERDSTIFCTKLPTIVCSSFLDNKYIMQITSNFIYVYSDFNSPDESSPNGKLILSHDISDRLDSKIKTAFINEIYSGILTEKGSVILYKFDDQTKKLISIESTILNSNNVSCFYIYKDESELFINNAPSKNDQDHLDKMNTSSLSNGDNIDLNKTNEKNNESTNFMDDNNNMNVDDEEELLYGHLNTNQNNPNQLPKSNTNLNESSSSYITKLLTEQNDLNKNKNNTNNHDNQKEDDDIQEVESQKHKMITFWLLTVSFDGTLSIFHLNDDEEDNCQLNYSCTKLNLASKLLVLKNHLKNNDSHSNLSKSMSVNEVNSQSQPIVQEILMMGFGFEQNRPILVAKTDEDLLIYEAFLTNSLLSNEIIELDSAGAPINNENNNKIYNPSNNNSANTQNDQINLKKINHEIIIRDKRKRKVNLSKKVYQDSNQNNTENMDAAGLSSTTQSTNENNLFSHDDYLSQRSNYTPSLRSFKNTAGFNGFFITGANNYFVFFCPRSGLTAHPFWLDGQVASFVPLKNTSITLSGFIYFNQNFDIRICSLPIEDGKSQIYYDSPWILKKIQLRQTIHFLCYHDESKTYAVATSVPEPNDKLMQLGGEDKELETFEKDENFILPNRNQFYIQLYTPNGWEQLPLGKYVLGEWEHVTSLKLVSLPYEGHSSGFRSYLAASTINCYNEDVNSRGRVLIFDVIEVEPEPDKPLTSIKMKTILEKEQKGPVTCLESVNGYLLGGVGQKIFIWEFKNNELIGKAFIDTNFYIHKMITLKNLVLIADLHHGISLIRFQQEYNKISFVAKDKQIMDTYACEYLVDNANLSFIATDSEKNLSIYMYQNESHDNQGGQWLVRKAEFNVGSHINSMFRIKCKVIDPHLDKRSAIAEKRHVTYCTNLDGGISYIIPISEKTFRRLFILQNTLYVMKQHYAGLNPKAYRSWKSKRKELINTQRNILDGDLLFEYFNMSHSERTDIAKKIKTNSEQLLDDLSEIFQFTNHF